MSLTICIEGTVRMTHAFLSVKSAETGVLVLVVSLTTHQTVGPGCPGLGAT